MKVEFSYDGAPRGGRATIHKLLRVLDDSGTKVPRRPVCCHSSEAEQRLRSRDCLPNVSLVCISNTQSCLRVAVSPAVDDKIATNPVAARTLLRFGTIHSFKHLWAPPGMGFLEWVSGLDHWTPLRGLGRAVRHGSCFLPGRRFG